MSWYLGLSNKEVLFSHIFFFKIILDLFLDLYIFIQILESMCQIMKKAYGDFNWDSTKLTYQFGRTDIFKYWVSQSKNIIYCSVYRSLLIFSVMFCSFHHRALAHLLLCLFSRYSMLFDVIIDSIFKNILMIAGISKLKWFLFYWFHV